MSLSSGRINGFSLLWSLTGNSKKDLMSVFRANFPYHQEGLCSKDYLKLCACAGRLRIYLPASFSTAFFIYTTRPEPSDCGWHDRTSRRIEKLVGFYTNAVVSETNFLFDGVDADDTFT